MRTMLASHRCGVEGDRPLSECQPIDEATLRARGAPVPPHTCTPECASICPNVYVCLYHGMHLCGRNCKRRERGAEGVACPVSGRQFADIDSSLESFVSQPRRYFDAAKATPATHDSHLVRGHNAAYLAAAAVAAAAAAADTARESAATRRAPQRTHALPADVFASPRAGSAPPRGGSGRSESSAAHAGTARHGSGVFGAVLDMRLGRSKQRNDAPTKPVLHRRRRSGSPARTRAAASPTKRARAASPRQRGGPGVARPEPRDGNGSSSSNNSGVSMSSAKFNGTWLRDHEAVKSRLRRLLFDPEPRNRLAKRARARRKEECEKKVGAYVSQCRARRCAPNVRIVEALQAECKAMYPRLRTPAHDEHRVRAYAARVCATWDVAVRSGFVDMRATQITEDLFLLAVLLGCRDGVWSGEGLGAVQVVEPDPWLATYMPAAPDMAMFGFTETDVNPAMACMAHLSRHLHLHRTLSLSDAMSRCREGE